MIRYSHLAAIVALLAVAGCSNSVRTSQFGAGPVTTTPQTTYQPMLAPTVNPAQETADARANTQIAGFVDPAIAGQLSQNSANQAAGAQFNALQFGRPGAPRAWQGDSGVSGSVTVGPYVRVNALDCRDFTHEVTVSGKTYTKQGTACREADGHWSVVGNSTG